MYFIYFIMISFILQRNHTLFGSVVSTLTGVRPILPFLNRTQSMYGNSTRGEPKINPLTSISAATAKLLQSQAANGNIGGPSSLNHLTSSDRPNLNHTPSPRPSPSPRQSLAAPPADVSRRPSRTRYNPVVAVNPINVHIMLSEICVSYVIGQIHLLLTMKLAISDHERPHMVNLA